MTRFILVLLFSSLNILSFSQEPEVARLYSSSSYKAFQNTFAIRIGYNELVNPQTKMGLIMEYHYNSSPQ